MASLLPDLRGHSLLAVLAHPDDESLACGGLLALCAEAGARTALLCLTQGEHGPGGVEGRPLGEVRAAELQEAARVLGLGEVVLLEHEDGMLPWLDEARLEADILAALRRFQPDLVVTFDEDGLYGHPDHIAVHERVTAVVRALDEAAPALFYVSMPAGAMRAVVEAAEGSAGTAAGAVRPPSKLLGVDVDAFGAYAPQPTLALEVGTVAARKKLSALRCHRTQVAESALDRLEDRAAARVLGVEHLRCASLGARGDVFFERLAAAATAAG